MSSTAVNRLDAIMGVMREAAAVSDAEAVGLTEEVCYPDSMASSDTLESCMDTSSTGSETADNEPCELDKPEYKTDDFRLFAFKIAPCTNEDPHDWCLCPFAHPGEKAMRRDPRLYKYTGVSCPDYRKGTCKRGNSCPYAHGVFEVWLHPSRYRTQTCKDAPHCTRQVCFFAHSPEELRQVDQEDLPVLDECSDASSGCSNLMRSDSDSTLSTDTMEHSPQMPRCGPNTNAKAAAVAKAKAAAAADKAAAVSSSGDKMDKASMKSSMLSRSSNNSSPATVNGRFPAGLQSLGGLGGPLSSSMLSMLSQGMLGVPGQGLGKQDWDIGSVLSGSGRLPSLPMDLIGDAATAAHSAGIVPLCDTFGSLDLAAAAAAAAGGASLANGWSGSSVGTAPAVGDANMTAATLAAASLGLPAPHLGVAGELNYLAEQYNTSSSSLALAAAAQQAASQQQQQQLQDVMTAVLLQQQLHQQQHRQAMWTAAFTAAANVGLNGAAAAACADAAVQSTTAANSNLNAGLTGSQMLPAGSNFKLGGLQDPQLTMPTANLMQQHLGVNGLLGGHCLAGIDNFSGQLPLQAAGFLQ